MHPNGRSPESRVLRSKGNAGQLSITQKLSLLTVIPTIPPTLFAKHSAFVRPHYARDANGKVDTLNTDGPCTSENMVLAPFFDKAPSIINKPDGSVLFECTCNANPEPKVQWFFKDKELTGDRYVFKVKKMVGKWACTMIMKNPTLQDQGQYKVVATNEHGTHSVEQGYVMTCTANEVFKTQ